MAPTSPSSDNIRQFLALKCATPEELWVCEVGHTGIPLKWTRKTMINGYWMILGHHIFRQTCEQSVGQRWAKQESLVSVSVPWDADQPGPGSTVGAPSSCQVRKGEMTCDGKTTSRKESGPVLRNQGNGNYWPLICKRLRTKGIQRTCDDETHEFSGSQPTAGSSALAKPLKSTAENPRRPHDFRILVDTFFQYSENNAKSQKDTLSFWKPFASVSWDGLAKSCWIPRCWIPGGTSRNPSACGRPMKARRVFNRLPRIPRLYLLKSWQHVQLPSTSHVHESHWDGVGWCGTVSLSSPLLVTKHTWPRWPLSESSGAQVAQQSPRGRWGRSWRSTPQQGWDRGMGARCLGVLVN